MFPEPFRQTCKSLARRTSVHAVANAYGYNGRFRYFWNEENRKVCASNAEVVVSYAYDHRGRMIRKSISRGGAEMQSISYTWDNWNIIGESLTTAHSTQTTYNIWGLDLDGTMQGAGGVGGLLAVVREDGTYLSAYDANGNISEYISAADGSVSAHRDYSPFGEPVISVGDTSSFSHWFSTKPWCGDTRLLEYQFRKYNPEIGRWMSRDPIEEKIDYVFIGNDGVCGVDYLGFSKVPKNTHIWVSGIDKNQEAYNAALKKALASGASKKHIKQINGGLKVLKRNVAQRGAASIGMLKFISAVGIGFTLGDIGVSAGSYFGLWGDAMPEVTIRQNGVIDCGDQLMAVPLKIKSVKRYGDIHQEGVLWGLGGAADYQTWYENSIEITMGCVCSPVGMYKVDYKLLSAPVSESWLWGALGAAKAMAYTEILTLTLEK